MAITDENGFKEVKVDGVQPSSIYQDVNREIYERGGVALTDAALRAKAIAQEAVPTFQLSTAGIVLWCSTAAAGIAAAGTVLAMPKETGILKEYHDLQDVFDKTTEKLKTVDSYSSEYTELYRTKNVAGLKIDEIDLERPDELAEANRKFIEKSNICKYLSAGFTVVMAILAGISIYTTIKEMMDFYKVTFSPIPKYIVERNDITATNEKGEEIMVQNQTAYYKVVTCNRTDGSSNVEKKNHEILLDRNDLNGDVGMQWLSLYSVKYENGLPILADSLKAKLGSDLPDGYNTGIHRFGETNAFNLTSKNYCYDDPYGGTYVYFKHDTTPVKDLTAAGSLFSGGSIAIGAAAGLIIGAGLTLLLMFSIKKKKEKQSA